MTKLTLKEVVIVEGRYDRERLKELIDSPVIETGGFRIFKDKEKQNLIRAAARSSGALILTDSDAAGFLIRNFLKSFLPAEKIKNAYIPEILGKEKRKPTPSKEGKLGVEGVSPVILREAIARSGATILGEREDAGANTAVSTTAEPITTETTSLESTSLEPTTVVPATAKLNTDELISVEPTFSGPSLSTVPITKADLYDLGLIGKNNAKGKRDALLKSLDFPTYLSTTAMLDALNAIFTWEEFHEYMKTNTDF